MSENKIQISKSQSKIVVLGLIILAIGYFGFYVPATKPAPSQTAEASFEDRRAEKEAELKKVETEKAKLELEAKKINLEKEVLEVEESLKVSGLESESSPQDPVTSLLANLTSVVAKTKISDDKTELPPDNEKEWATKIDAYIAKFNPKINNQGCGTITGQDWVNAGKKYGNHPYFLVAIARADTSLGKGLTNRCNLGNTGHCDSCRKGNRYGSFINSVSSISQTLSNQYLGKGTLSCHFSRGGWKQCPEGETINNGKFYASSLVNWDNNVNDTLAELFGYKSNKYHIKL